MDFDEAHSQEQNINPQIQYEQCPYCSRNFFKGKLQLHLKLCNADNPMVISPKKTPKRKAGKLSQEQKQEKETHQNNHEHKCPYCNVKLPAFLYEKHINKCKDNHSNQEKQTEEGGKKSQTEMDFKKRDQITLPVIKHSTKETYQLKKSILKDTYRVKLRDELSCFRKAQQIKSVQCMTCGRIFSKAASLRHIPICQQLRLKQQYENTFKKRKPTFKSTVIEQLRHLSSQKHKKTRSCLYEKDSKLKVQQIVLEKPAQQSQKIAET